MSKSKLTPEQKEEYKERRKLSWEGLFYSGRRMDLLIVSICSGGIYVILEVVKYLVSQDLIVTWDLKTSGMCFIVGIIVNFISQRYGLKSNEHDYLSCSLNLQDTIDKEEIKTHDDKSDYYTKWTESINQASMYIMFIGLALMTCYFLFTF